MELIAGDKITVTAELLQGNFNVYANGTYLGGYSSTVGDVSCTIQIKAATTLTSLGIVSSNANDSKYTITSIEIEKTERAPLNLNFANYTEIPAFVMDSIGGMYLQDGKLMHQWSYGDKQGIYVAYDSVELKAGDTITVTAELVQGSFNVGINGSYAGGYKSTAGDATCTIQIKAATTLKSLGIYSSKGNPAAIYKITSIVINQA